MILDSGVQTNHHALYSVTRFYAKVLISEKSFDEE